MAGEIMKGIKTEDRGGTPADALRCERCGRLDGRKMGEHVLCEECYFACGSCCMEFGADDFWAEAGGEKPGA